jgi:hypothetical protein
MASGIPASAKAGAVTSVIPVDFEGYSARLRRYSRFDYGLQRYSAQTEIKKVIKISGGSATGRGARLATVSRGDGHFPAATGPPPTAVAAFPQLPRSGGPAAGTMIAKTFFLE